MALFRGDKRYLNTKPFFLASPAVLMLLILVFLPLVMLVLFSFHPDAPGKQDVWTLENYKFVFINNPLFYKVLFRTILISLYSAIISLFICFPVAYYVAKIARKENRLTLVLLIIIPNMVSGFMIILSWLLFLADYGVLYFILKYLKLIEGPLHILYTPWALIIGFIYSNTLWMFIPLYAVLESLDNSLIEAAADLGASNNRVLLRIIIPYSKTAISIGCILTFLGALSSYIMPRFLGGKSGLMYIQLVFDAFYTSYNWNRGAVMGIFMLVIMVVVVFIGIKASGTSIKETVEAIKK